MWYRLIESTNNAHYMCQISSQSDEWCQKERGGVRLTLPPPLMPSCDFFYLMPSRVNMLFYYLDWVQIPPASHSRPGHRLTQKGSILKTMINVHFLHISFSGKNYMASINTLLNLTISKQLFFLISRSEKN